MLPDRVSNPVPLTYESGALPIALRGPASLKRYRIACRCGFSLRRYRIACKCGFITYPDRKYVFALNS